MPSDKLNFDSSFEPNLLTPQTDIYTANGDAIAPALNESHLATNTFQDLVLDENVFEVPSLVEETVLFAPHIAVENTEASWIEMTDITGDKFDVYTGEIDLHAQDWKIVDRYSEIITDISSVVSGENIDESFSTQLVEFLVIDGKDFMPEESEIILTSFNNEQILETGESIDITWTDNIDDNVAIALYQGDSFVADIAESTESDGSYIWKVSDDIFPGSDYNLKISSVADDNISDLSDANFNIYKPEITIISLDNGETFKPGEEVHLTWTDNLFENVKIDLYRDNSLVETIAESTTSDGETLWIVPNNLPYSDRYKIKISSVNNENINDITPEFFSIFQPEIDVLSNLQDFTLEPGEDYSIIWNDNIDENVSIDLYREDNLVSTIVESTASDGNYVWTVPDNIAIDDTYQIRVYGSADSTVSDFSDGYFTVKQPDITVVSLNGGNRLELGQSFEITWTNNIEEDVAIDLYQNGSLKQNIVQNTSNDGSYIWNVPTDLEEGFDYQIKISSAIDSSIYDKSDRSFVIEAEDAVDNLTSFNNLGTISTGKIFDNSALNVSTNKLHRFEVDTPSLFELDFNGSSSTYKVELIQDLNNNGLVDDKEILAHTQQSGTYNDLSIPLLPGTYFIRDDFPFYPVKTFDFDPTASNNYGLNFGAIPLDAPNYTDPAPVTSYFGDTVTRRFYNNVEDNGVSSYQSQFGNFFMYGDIVDYYTNNYFNDPSSKDGLFGVYTGIGLPTSPIYIDTDGNQVMEFEGGTLTNINGAVTAKYNQKNGDRFELVGKGAPDGMELQWKNDYAWHNPNSLGQPKGEVRRIKNGWIQEFESSNGSRTIFLVKDGQKVEGGFEDFIDRDGSTIQVPKSGPYLVAGAIANFYFSSGGYERENGLGFPIGRESGIFAAENNYYYHQPFENGFIAETKDGQVLIKDNQGNFFNVVGYDQNGIAGTYVNTFNRNGGETKLGSPTNNVHRWGGGYVQDFSGGSEGSGIIMKSDANDNSYWVGGKFWEIYRANGDIGKLGYPTSDVFNDGYGNLAQDFGEYRITVQSNGNAFIGGYVKGHKLEGDFFNAWRKYDLGTPVSRHNYNGTQFWYFDKPGLGRVSAVSTQYGTFPLWGGIREYYISRGVDGLGGDLGKPKSAEYSWDGKIRQDFEGGYIIFDGRARGYRPDGSPLINSLPVINVNNITVHQNSIVNNRISMNNRFSWFDANGNNTVTKIAFYDYSHLGGFTGIGKPFVDNNGKEGIIVDRENLNSVYYFIEGNHINKSGQIQLAAFDGREWGSPKAVNITVVSDSGASGSGSSSGGGSGFNGGNSGGGSTGSGSNGGNSGGGSTGSGNSDGSGGGSSTGGGNIIEGTKPLQFNLDKTSLRGTGNSKFGFDKQGQFDLNDKFPLGFIDFNWYLKGSAGAYFSTGEVDIKIPSLFKYEYNEYTDIFEVSSISIDNGNPLLSTYLGGSAGIDFELGFGLKINEDVKIVGGTGIPSYKAGYELDAVDVIIGAISPTVGQFIDLDLGINAVDKYLENIEYKYWDREKQESISLNKKRLEGSDTLGIKFDATGFFRDRQIPGTSLKAKDVLSADIAVNIEQKTLFDITGFRFDTDNFNNNGNEFEFLFGQKESSKYKIDNLDNLRVQPIATLNTKFIPKLEGSIGVSLQTAIDNVIENSIPKSIPLRDRVVQTTKEIIKVSQDLKLEPSLTIPDLEFEISEFNPYKKANFWINWS